MTIAAHLHLLRLHRDLARRPASAAAAAFATTRSPPFATGTHPKGLGMTGFSRRALSSAPEGMCQVQGRPARRGMATFVPPLPVDHEHYVRIVEVSPRDGLQNLPPPAVAADIKRELVQRLRDAGVRNIEVGSFVRGDRVPQMANTTELLPTLPLADSGAVPSSVPAWDAAVHYPVLVPNMRGLESLLALEEACRAQGRKGRLTDEIAVFVSATDPFSVANNGAPVSKILPALPPVISKAREHGYRVRGYVSCVMADPYAGATPPRPVADVAEQLLAMGCYEVSLGDTTGEGNPAAWRALWDELQARGVPLDQVAAHCHDTFSLALSSLLTLLPHGLRSIDASLAGLGGCPYSPGATGNVPTEDVVYALHKLGYNTGIDLDRLVEAGAWLCATLGIRNESRVGRAMWARRGVKEKKEREQREKEQEQHQREQVSPRL